MSAPWSPLQLHVLAAMGHAVYRPVAGWTQTPGAPARESEDNPARCAIEGLDFDPADALVAAVLRAAGLDIHARIDLPDWWLAHGLPAPATLRADAAAKRALWPRLRALRRGRG